MVAAPQRGFLKIVGTNKKTYMVDLYANDVDKNKVNLDDGAGAGTGSETFYTNPVDGAIVDFAIHTGMTDTMYVKLTVNGVIRQLTLRFAAHLDTSDARPALGVGVKANARIGLIQFAD